MQDSETSSSTRRASCCPEVWRTSTGALLKQRPSSHCLACVSRSQRGRKVAATPFPPPRSPQEQRLPDPIHTQNLGCRRVSGECSIWLSCFCSSLECYNTSWENQNILNIRRQRWRLVTGRWSGCRSRVDQRVHYTDERCHLEQVTSPLWASLCRPEKWAHQRAWVVGRILCHLHTVPGSVSTRWMKAVVIEICIVEIHPHFQDTKKRQQITPSPKKWKEGNNKEN